MRRFLLGLFTALLTLAVTVGAGMVLSALEPEALPVAEPTVPETTVMTLPPETEATLPPETEATLPPETEPVPVTYDTVPLYYQTDYPHVKFGNGTIATSGCSVTCLAMVATYLTDREYTPVEMAYHFGSYGKTHVDRLNYGISQMQLPYQRSHNIQEVMQAMDEGKVAIVMMDEESYFTMEQHFIVLAGRNEAGKVVVNDPLETNLINATVHLRDCYENGFEYHHLSKGFTGAWIFDKKDMPEEPFLYDASLPEQRENRYKGYTLTEEDIYTLACFVQVEAGNEPAEARQAVAEVVLNRIMSPNYPSTLRKAIMDTELFRAENSMKYVKEPDLECYMAVDAAMYGPYILPEDICFYSAWAKGQDPWGQLGSFTFYKDR